MNLRPYQTRAIEALRARVAVGERRLLLVAPCAFGKTAVATHIIRNALGNGIPALFIVHRRELVTQACNALTAAGLRVGVIQASDPRADAGAPVQVASIATLVRRGSYPPAGIVIPDECHLSSSDGWRSVLRHYDEQGAITIGLTATPIRLDQKPLGDYFQSIVIGATYEELIDQGYLAKPVIFSPKPPEPLGLEQIATRHGDYVVEQLGAVMSKPRIVGSIVDEWHRRGQGYRTIVFAVNVAHSRSIVEKFNAFYGSEVAAHVDASTPEEERGATWSRLRAGKIAIVSNVGIATEGFDLPAVKTIVLARPTQSLALYLQMSGRLMRPWNDVTPVLLDHGGNVARHGVPFLDRPWSLSEKPVRTAEKNPYHCCGQCFAWVEKNPCELCGWSRPVEVQEIEVDESVKLEEHRPLTLEEMQAIEARKRAFFDRMTDKARFMGFSPWMPTMSYKSEFKEEPPREWTSQVQRIFKADRDWQQRHNARKAAKGAA